MLDTTQRWEPKRSPQPSQWHLPSLPVALARGFRGLCPACGQTHLFNGFLTVKHVCEDCAAPLGLARADDAPPYFTIVIVGHIIIAAMLIVEKAYAPPLWVHTAIWIPLTIILALALLRPVKGATVGLMLHLGMMKSDDERDG